jgi:hypothetical protein
MNHDKDDRIKPTHPPQSAIIVPTLAEMMAVAKVRVNLKKTNKPLATSAMPPNDTNIDWETLFGQSDYESEHDPMEGPSDWRKSEDEQLTRNILQQQEDENNAWAQRNRSQELTPTQTPSYSTTKGKEKTDVSWQRRTSNTPDYPQVENQQKQQPVPVPLSLKRRPAAMSTGGKVTRTSARRNQRNSG